MLSSRALISVIVLSLFYTPVLSYGSMVNSTRYKMRILCKTTVPDHLMIDLGQVHFTISFTDTLNFRRKLLEQ